MMRKLLPPLLLAVGILILIMYPDAAAEGVSDGLRLSGSTLLPSLFPFFVLTRFCAALWRISEHRATSRVMHLFGVDGACFPALFMSFVGGYPVGISTVCDLYRSGRITKRDAQRCLVFCNNSGPAFFTAVIGRCVFDSVPIGLLLYAIHVLTALVCARLFAQPVESQVRVRKMIEKPVSPAAAFSDALVGSCSACLQITASVMLFSVFLSLLRSLPLTEVPAPLIGMLELSNGVVLLSADARGFVASAFLMGWGGFCVHLQAMSFWGDLRPRGYWLEKLLHGLLSAGVALVLLDPKPLKLLFATAFLGFCLFYPAICKKCSGNLRENAI